MGLISKIKDILFEEEEYTEAIKIPEVKKTEEVKDFSSSVPKKEETSTEKKVVEPEVKSEREIFKSENNFNFPEFDEEEFDSNIAKISKEKPNGGVSSLEYERKKVVERRNDYGRYERVEIKEYTEKRKFKPSPIISPVYGILNQDYKAEDIVDKKNSASNINIDEVRKKAFAGEQEELLEPLNKEDVIDEPVVTFFEEKENAQDTEKKEDTKDEEVDFKSIDDLLEEASSEINLEDTMEVPLTNNLDVIEEELEKIDSEVQNSDAKDLDDTLDSDLFELIDSMYEDREEGEK